MSGILIPIVGMMIPIVAIIVDYFQKRDKMRVIEKAIERGVQLDGLSLKDPVKKRMPYRGGMVCLAVGLGLIVMNLTFFAGDRPDYFINFTNTLQVKHSPLFGVGALVAFIGIALIINDKMNYKRYFEDQDNNPPKTGSV